LQTADVLADGEVFDPGLQWAHRTPSTLTTPRPVMVSRSKISFA